jgi:hypothetical protein
MYIYKHIYIGEMDNFIIDDGLEAEEEEDELEGGVRPQRVRKVCIYMCVYICVCNIYINIHMCIYICIYIYIYVYEHI